MFMFVLCNCVEMNDSVVDNERHVSGMAFALEPEEMIMKIFHPVFAVLDSPIRSYKTHHVHHLHGFDEQVTRDRGQLPFTVYSSAKDERY